jgi:hypothetical protein
MMWHIHPSSKLQSRSGYEPLQSLSLSALVRSCNCWTGLTFSSSVARQRLEQEQGGITTTVRMHTQKPADAYTRATVQAALLVFVHARAFPKGNRGRRCKRGLQIVHAALLVFVHERAFPNAWSLMCKLLVGDADARAAGGKSSQAASKHAEPSARGHSGPGQASRLAALYHKANESGNKL